MTSTPEDLASRALEHVLQLPGPRNLVALAGPPGAGKSTVSQLLLDRLIKCGRRAAVVPMDGFHLDNRVLKERGLLHRKGAPETFDASGFGHLVARIANGEADVVYPVFDRQRDIAIAGAAVLSSDIDVVLFEGNYLLLRDAPWAQLKSHWTSSIWIDAPLDQLEARLMDRWFEEGLSEPEARAKVEGNDLANTRYIVQNSMPGDLMLSTSV